MNVGTQMTKRGEMRGKSLAELVEMFRAHFPHPDPVVEFTVDSPTLLDAIARAVDGRDRAGKMYSEGTCVRFSSKEEFKYELCVRHREVANAKNFDDVYDVLRAARPWGIGDCTTYNCAVRIAAYLGFEPENYLYLHAGPKQGWRRLTGLKKEKRHRVPMTEVPKALHVLSVKKIEDFFCEMRDAVHPGLLE